MQAEAPEEASAEEHEKARISRDRPLGLIHTGNRYAFGYGPDFYGLWDAASSGPPSERFPATDDGRQAGWRRYVELEPSAAGVVTTVESPDVVWRRETEQSRVRRRRNTLITLAVIVVVIAGGIVALTTLTGGGGEKAATQLSQAAKAKKAHIDLTGGTSVSEDLTQTDFVSTPLESLIGASNKGIWQGTTIKLTIDIHNPQTGEVSTTVIPPRTVIIEIKQSDGTTATLRSTNGECKVTMDEVSDIGFSGKFACTGLPLPEGAGTVDAEGTFGGSK